MPINKLGLRTFASSEELDVQQKFLELFKKCPIPQDELLQNMGLFITSKLFTRILFLYHVYLLQLSVHGIIMDFGTRWGQNMSIFCILRSIFEPFNRHRKVVGFDTFHGFASVSEKDGLDDVAKKGKYSVTSNYGDYLQKIMNCQEKLNPLGHIKRFEIEKGDAVQTLKQYLERHPETVVSLAYFDMDLYEPTKKCLEQLIPYLTKGAIIGFDELADETFPGETIAFREVFGQKYKIHRLPTTARASYIVID